MTVPHLPGLTTLCTASYSKLNVAGHVCKAWVQLKSANASVLNVSLNVSSAPKKSHNRSCGSRNMHRDRSGCHVASSRQPWIYIYISQ